MTFRNISSKKLLISGLAAVALSLSTGAFASVSANSGHGAQSPVVESQCTHPGYRHFGFSSKRECVQYVNAHNRPGQGQGQQGSGYGGNGNGNTQNIFVTIGNVVNGAVNITINFVTNIFSH